MTSHEEGHTLKAALESELAAIEQVREALPDGSHLLALCGLITERLASFLAPPRSAPLPAQVETTDPHIETTEKNKRGRLAGTIRRIAVDSRHPTGWIFATKLSGMPLDAMLDPRNVMNAAEQLDGKEVLLTGYFAGDVNLHLVADSLEAS